MLGRAGPGSALAALLAAALVAVMVITAPPTAYESQPAFVANPVDHVDTLIGTGRGGRTVGEINNFPGASLPFGMVQYSPDTVDTYAGYNYHKDRVTGFSMTHASVGCAAFGDISMLPTTAPVGSHPWDATEKIAHDDTEVGVPGYYTVRFPDTKVIAELTASTRTGVGRFRYPRNGRPARLHVRSGGSLAGNSAATLQIGEDNATITGSATSGGFCGKKNTYTVYFAMKFNRPFTSYGTWDGDWVYPGGRVAFSSDSGGYVEFPPGSALEVRTALSYVGVEGARANLAAEGGASFDDVRATATREWNTVLSRIAVAGADGAAVKTFYTAFYHSLLHPNTFNDADGRYLGFDGAIHAVPPGHTQYTNFSDWDTYRGVAALHGLLFPERASDMAQSLVNDAEQSGSFPRWALANAATAEMTGDSVVPLIVNLYVFGAKDFDAHTALRYMVGAATDGGVGRGGYVERPGIATYLQRGYLPVTSESCLDGSVPGASITLEWSVDDFAISRFAGALGDSATAGEFQRRAQYWQNLFNPTTRYLSPRNVFGFFARGPGFVRPPPFCFGQVGFDEGNAAQYVWWVPQNIAGLVTALGGRKAVTERLDRFTRELNAGPDKPYLWIGNEPGFGVPWLYNYVGQPWKTQDLVDRVRGSLFGPTPDGEPGNDDLGALSSWYVWAALGLYPGTPGTASLTVSTPLFDRIVIALPAGRFIRIFASGVSAPNRLRYINGLSVNGRPTDRTFLPESILRGGGTLVFALSATPGNGWGTAASAAPPSFGAGSSAVTVNVVPDVVASAPGTTATVTVDAQRMIGGAPDYTITGTAYSAGITVAPVSGRFASDGSASATVAISVAPSVLDGYYPLVLTTTSGEGTRTFMLLVAVGQAGAEQWPRA
ncbi:GH92 family glycosyl hydrolase [Mycobacterium sp. SM1]|uniref:GH92 family glycosyl hydrolase n=1 Tax=Mycobacterium sp. SM1 TaxID=2816243 RepID=UPI001BD02C36|nr:GH92 family glycosyl hydrolase [Mycobacterium sp. SM1]MBS4728713.1 GH92 family glycosyl hydrolase [Mycobacterium sp. SM1]